MVMDVDAYDGVLADVVDDRDLEPPFFPVPPEADPVPDVIVVVVVVDDDDEFKVLFLEEEALVALELVVLLVPLFEG